jgi:hypothetical protein
VNPVATLLATLAAKRGLILASIAVLGALLGGAADLSAFHVVGFWDGPHADTTGFWDGPH